MRPYKKAIEYYEEQGLTHPQIMGNGYRVFSEDDVIRLNKIAVLRGLGISVADIKRVLAENDHHGLRSASRWFCKFYCSKAVIVGLIFNTRQETISVSHIVMFAEKTYNAFEPVGHTKRRKERES